MPVNPIGVMGVQPNGDLKVIKGDDYSGARKLRWDDPSGLAGTKWDDYVGNTTTFTIDFPAGDFTKAATISDVATQNVVDVEPLSSETKLWPIGSYPFDIQVTDVAGKDVTIVRGFIEVLQDQTASTA